MSEAWPDERNREAILRAAASLAAEDDQTPVAPPGLGRTVGQQGQRRLPLQQFHASSVGHPRSLCHYGRSPQ